MSNKPLLSIAIPTYNRAAYLQNLLDNILPQATQLDGMVQICISNNCSTDNTRELVLGLQKRYPNLIKCSENKQNLGFDMNVLKVVEMSDGEFIWTLSDDESITDNGLDQVVKFINEVN